MGDEGCSIPNQLGTVTTDGAAHLAVIVVNRTGFRQELVRQSGLALRMCRDQIAHAIESPEQVHCRGAAGGQVVGRGASRFAGAIGMVTSGVAQG